MKRQRNSQKVKEQDKYPPNQTREEEIGNLPDREFQIMIVKMIQNLEIKMEPFIFFAALSLENLTLVCFNLSLLPLVSGC